MTTPSPSLRRSPIGRIIWIAGILALVALMILNTKFLSSDEAAAVNPAKFNTADYAKENYPDIVKWVEENAMPLTDAATELAADPKKGAELGNPAGTDKFAIPVALAGTVTAADANFITVTVEGMPGNSTVRIAVGQAANGTALRDVTGKIKFADFVDQTDYQQVANELKILALDKLKSAGTFEVGASVEVTGVIVTNTGPAGSFLVTPLSIGTGA